MRGTPPARAISQHSIFGIMPPEIIPVAFSEPMAVRSMRLIKVEGSSMLRKIHATFVS